MKQKDIKEQMLKELEDKKACLNLAERIVEDVATERKVNGLSAIEPDFLEVLDQVERQYLSNGLDIPSTYMVVKRSVV